MITWSQLNIHSKPIVIFNVNGYYDHFISMIERSTREQFVSVANSHIFVAVNTAEQVIAALYGYRTPRRAFEVVWHAHEQDHLG